MKKVEDQLLESQIEVNYLKHQLHRCQDRYERVSQELYDLKNERGDQ